MNIKAKAIIGGFGIFILIIGLAACQTNNPTTEFPNPTYSNTPTFSIKTSSATPTPSLITQPDIPTTPTRTPRPTNPWPTLGPTPTPIRKYSSPTPITITPGISLNHNLQAYNGTQVPGDRTAVGINNHSSLIEAAEWGKGSILSVAYTPDGSRFVVGSAYGLALYATENPEKPPVWWPFDVPFYYTAMYFNTDSSLLLLESRNEKQIYRFAEGLSLVTEDPGNWIIPSRIFEERSGELDSPNSRLRLKFSSGYDEEYGMKEILNQALYNQQDGSLLFALGSETIYIDYTDYHEPEGCDLSSFSMCGNVYIPIASLPFQVGFSPDNDNIAILYRPHDLSPNRFFGMLRVYSTTDGRLQHMFGGLKNPVASFAYSPDGGSLLVGFIDGSITVWDISQDKLVSTAWHFNSPIVDLEFTPDSKYLLIQRPTGLEIRTTNNGALWHRFSATAFAVSPVQNLVAIGDEDGSLLLFDLSHGTQRFVLQPDGSNAHKAKILALAFSPDGQTLVSAGQDCALRAWEVASGRFLHYFEESWTDAYEEGFTRSRIYIYNLAFIPGTNQLIGSGSWARVVSWNMNSGSAQFIVEPEPLAYYQGMVTLNPHFPEFFSFDFDQSVFYVDNMGYEMTTGQPSGQYRPSENLPDGCSGVGPFSPDGRIQFTPGYKTRNGQICILDTQNDNSLLMAFDVVQAYEMTNYTNHFIGIDWLYLSPDGSQLVVSTADGLVRVFQVGPVDQ